MAKTRNILIGLLVLEILTLPAAAQIVNKVVFEAPQKAVAVELPPEPGLSKFVVTSNAPFTLVADNAEGDFEIHVHQSGTVNGNRFGDNAQMPGRSEACATVVSSHESAIYRADRKTAAQPGEILSQAVIIEVRYDASVTPELRIETEQDSRNIVRALPCVSDLSELTDPQPRPETRLQTAQI